MPLPEPVILDMLERLGIMDVTCVEPVTGGFDTEIWRITHGDALSALRIFRAGQYGSAESERMAISAAGELVPVPRLRAAGTWNDRPLTLLEWSRGISMGAALFEAPGRAWELGALLGETQARIHTIDAPSGLPRIAETWSERAGVEPPETSDDQRLLHFDLHPLNVLIDGDTVSGVIDWTNAGAGDPRLDAARTLAILNAAPLPETELDYDDLDAMRRQLIAGWEAGYQRIAGDPGDLTPFLLWAGAIAIDDLSRKPAGLPGIAEMITRMRGLMLIWSNEDAEGNEE